MDTIYCNACMKEFRIKAKRKKRNFTIEEHYFVCPHCKTKYTAYYTDAECRKLIRAIGKLQEEKRPAGILYTRQEIDGPAYRKQIDLIDSKIKEKQTILKARMDSLEAEYSN